MRSPGRIRTKSPTLTSSIGNSSSWVPRTTCAASGRKSKSTDFEEHMLVEDAAPQRLNGHVKDMTPDAEDEHKSERAGEPRSGINQISVQIEVEQRERHGREATGPANRGP